MPEIDLDFYGQKYDCFHLKQTSFTKVLWTVKLFCFQYWDSYITYRHELPSYWKNFCVLFPSPWQLQTCVWKVDTLPLSPRWKLEIVKNSLCYFSDVPQTERPKPNPYKITFLRLWCCFFKSKTLIKNPFLMWLIFYFLFYLYLSMSHFLHPIYQKTSLNYSFSNY